MKKPWIWFAPIYGLLIALVLSVAYLGHVSAKSARQKDATNILGLIKDTVLPGGKINTANSNQGQIFLYCVNQDAIAAANHLPTVAKCAGKAPAP